MSAVKRSNAKTLKSRITLKVMGMIMALGMMAGAWAIEVDLGAGYWCANGSTPPTDNTIQTAVAGLGGGSVLNSTTYASGVLTIVGTGSARDIEFVGEAKATTTGSNPQACAVINRITFGANIGAVTWEAILRENTETAGGANGAFTETAARVSRGATSGTTFTMNKGVITTKRPVALDWTGGGMVQIGRINGPDRSTDTCFIRADITTSLTGVTPTTRGDKSIPVNAIKTNGQVVINTPLTGTYTIMAKGDNGKAGKGEMVSRGAAIECGAFWAQAGRGGGAIEITGVEGAVLVTGEGATMFAHNTVNYPIPSVGASGSLFEATRSLYVGGYRDKPENVKLISTGLNETYVVKSYLHANGTKTDRGTVWVRNARLVSAGNGSSVVAIGKKVEADHLFDITHGVTAAVRLDSVGVCKTDADARKSPFVGTAISGQLAESTGAIDIVGGTFGTFGTTDTRAIVATMGHRGTHKSWASTGADTAIFISDAKIVAGKEVKNNVLEARRGSIYVVAKSAPTNVISEYEAKTENEGVTIAQADNGHILVHSSFSAVCSLGFAKPKTSHGNVLRSANGNILVEGSMVRAAKLVGGQGPAIWTEIGGITVINGFITNERLIADKATVFASRGNIFIGSKGEITTRIEAIGTLGKAVQAERIGTGAVGQYTGVVFVAGGTIIGKTHGILAEQVFVRETNIHSAAKPAPREYGDNTNYAAASGFISNQICDAIIAREVLIQGGTIAIDAINEDAGIASTVDGLFGGTNNLGVWIDNNDAKVTLVAATPAAHDNNAAIRTSKSNIYIRQVNEVLANSGAAIRIIEESGNIIIRDGKIRLQASSAITVQPTAKLGDKFTVDLVGAIVSDGNVTLGAENVAGLGATVTASLTGSGTDVTKMPAVIRNNGTSKTVSVFGKSVVSHIGGNAATNPTGIYCWNGFVRVGAGLDEPGVTSGGVGIYVGGPISDNRVIVRSGTVATKGASARAAIMASHATGNGELQPVHVRGGRVSVEGGRGIWITGRGSALISNLSNNCQTNAIANAAAGTLTVSYPCLAGSALQCAVTEVLATGTGIGVETAENNVRVYDSRIEVERGVGIVTNGGYTRVNVARSNSLASVIATGAGGKSIEAKKSALVNPRSGVVLIGGGMRHSGLVNQANTAGDGSHATDARVEVFSYLGNAIEAVDSVLVGTNALVHVSTGTAIKADYVTLVGEGEGSGGYNHDPAVDGPEVRATGDLSKAGLAEPTIGPGVAIEARRFVMTGGKVLAGTVNAAVPGGARAACRGVVMKKVAGANANSGRDSMIVVGGRIEAYGPGIAVEFLNDFEHSLLAIDPGARVRDIEVVTHGNNDIITWVMNGNRTGSDDVESGEGGVEIKAGNGGIAIKSDANVLINRLQPDGENEFLSEGQDANPAWATVSAGLNGTAIRATGKEKKVILKQPGDTENTQVIVRAGKFGKAIHSVAGVTDSILGVWVEADDGGIGIDAEGQIVISKGVIKINGDIGTGIRSAGTSSIRFVKDIGPDGTPYLAGDSARVISRDYGIDIAGSGAVTIEAHTALSGIIMANVTVDGNTSPADADDEWQAILATESGDWEDAEVETGMKLTIPVGKWISFVRGGKSKINELDTLLILGTLRSNDMRVSQAGKLPEFTTGEGRVILAPLGDIVFGENNHRSFFNTSGATIVLSKDARLQSKPIGDYLYWADTLKGLRSGTPPNRFGESGANVIIPAEFAKDEPNVWGGTTATAVDSVYSWNDTRLKLIQNQTYVAREYHGDTAFGFVSGNLPVGFKSSRNDSALTIDKHGVIEGLLTKADTYNFRAFIENEAGKGEKYRTEKNYTIKVNRRTPVINEHFYGRIAEEASKDATPEERKLIGAEEPISAFYTGKRISVSIVADTLREIEGSAGEWNIPVTGLGTATVLYRGIDGTFYERTTIPPTNVGTYRVEAAFSEGSNFVAVSSNAPITLGTMEILPSSILDVLVPGQEIVGYTLPVAKVLTAKIPLPDVTRFFAQYDLENITVVGNPTSPEFLDESSVTIYKDDTLTFQIVTTDAKLGNTLQFTIPVIGGERQNIDDGDITVSVLFTNVAGLTESTPYIRINFADETIDGFEAGKKYTVLGSIPVTGDVALPVNAAWFGDTVTVIALATTEHRFPSAAQKLYIPLREEYPEDLTSDSSNVVNGIDRLDGAIVGTTTLMQYRKVGTAVWTTAANSRTIVGAGDYEVRLAATTTAFASDAAIVTVPARYTGVAEVERDVKGDDVAVVAPVKPFAGEFTVGSNPVVKSAGKAVFFWQGAALKKGTVKVFDANGNVVKSVSIDDKAASNSARREVGAWKLDDAKGRSVADGTYVVKGVLFAKDGSKVKVSYVVSVQ